MRAAATKATTKRNSRGRVVIPKRGSGSAQMASFHARVKRGVHCAFCNQHIPYLDVRQVGSNAICGECRAYPIREVFNGSSLPAPPSNLIKQYNLREIEGKWVAL